MKLGIISPVLSRFPGMHANWEVDGTIDDVARIAKQAERLGYEYVSCSEHVAIPADALDGRGGTYWDPLATFGYLAARTTTIRFATVIVVLPYHHPLDILKRYGTLDRITGGRLILGVGVGYLEPEFEALGVPYDGRGERSDDALRAIRASFGLDEPSYQGSHYRFGGLVVSPCGLQRDLPIWVGGRTRRSLRRAAELGDGWCPFGIGAEELGAWLQKEPAVQERERPLEVVFPVRLDPLGDPQATEAAAVELRDAGATILSMRFPHESIEHYIEQLEAMKELADRL